MHFLPWKQQNTDAVGSSTDPGAVSFFSDIIAQRGLSAPRDTALHDPYLLCDMDKAVQRIRMALKSGERILVYGDYDCDGVSATVMLYDYLENTGADVLYYIPQREGEGYGLNCDAVERIREAAVQLIITVDNGISSVEEIALATSYGIDVVVTDHHRPKEQLPVCTAVIDPHRADCNYPFRGLCGAGVVFKLISALESDAEGIVLELYGDLLAVATMADVVPLLGENRALVQAGIAAMAAGERAGLAALAQVAGIKLDQVTGEQIAFGIAPRINVTGRIDSVDLAVELLLTQDENEAKQLADRINNLNTKRKEIESEIVADIGRLLTAEPALSASRVLVLCGNGWHPGVIGITAARLVERYGKPCIILTRMENGELRGSARSVEGFSIIEAIHACGAHLLKYGGHPMAAGLSLRADRLAEFTTALEQYCGQRHPQMPRRYLSVDGAIKPRDITLENIVLLDSMQPFGCGNPQPVPVLYGVTLRGIAPMGGGNHLRLTLEGEGRVEAVYFSMTPESFPFPIGAVVDCAVSLSVNCWQGVQKPSVRVVSMRPQGFPMESKLRGQELFDGLRRGEQLDPADAEVCTFGRGDLSAAFRMLRELSPCKCGSDWLLHRLGEQYGGFRLLAALEILGELGLITAKREKTGMVYTVVPSEGKADLSDAPTYRKLAAMKLVKAE